jgi:hypothetical protein
VLIFFGRRKLGRVNPGHKFLCNENVAQAFVTLTFSQRAPLVQEMGWTLQFTVWVSCLRGVKYQASCCVGENGAGSWPSLWSQHCTISGTFLRCATFSLH